MLASSSLRPAVDDEGGTSEECTSDDAGRLSDDRDDSLFSQERLYEDGQTGRGDVTEGDSLGIRRRCEWERENEDQQSSPGPSGRLRSNGFNTLSRELGLKILRIVSLEVEGFRQLCNLEMLCRSLRSLVQLFWDGIRDLGQRELFLIGAPPNRVVRWLYGVTAKCRHVQKLDLSWCRDTNFPLTDPCLIEMASRCPALESLNLRWSR